MVFAMNECDMNHADTRADTRQCFKIRMQTQMKIDILYPYNYLT